MVYRKGMGWNKYLNNDVKINQEPIYGVWHYNQNNMWFASKIICDIHGMSA